VNENLDRIKIEIRRSQPIRNTVGSFSSETPLKYFPRSRAVSASRGYTSEPKIAAPGGARPLSVERKYYPRYTVDPFDVGSLQRRRMRIDDAVRKYESDTKIYTKSIDNTSSHYPELQEDLDGVWSKLNDHMNKLQMRERLLKAQLDKLESEAVTSRGEASPRFLGSANPVPKTDSSGRRSFGEPLDKRYHQSE
jgi:hypothetical protein